MQQQAAQAAKDKAQAAKDKAQAKIDKTLNNYINIKSVNGARWTGTTDAATTVIRMSAALSLVVEEQKAAGDVPTPDPKPTVAAAAAAAATAAAATAAAATAAAGTAGVGAGAAATSDLADDGTPKKDKENFKDPFPLTQVDYSNASGGNTCSLLHPVNGFNQGNLGLMCIFRDMMLPYKVFQKITQTTKKPVQYIVLETIDNMLAEQKAMYAVAAGEDVGGPLFLAWKKGIVSSHQSLESSSEAEKLVKILDKEAVESADGWFLCWNKYFSPYKLLFLGCALASPFAPHKYVIDEDAVDAMKMICDMLQIEYSETALQMRTARAKFGDMSYSDRVKAHANLLAFMDESLRLYPEFWGEKCPLALEYVSGVLSVLLASNFIEGVFSEMDHATKDRRSSTHLDVVMAYQYHKSAKRRTADAAEDSDGIGAGKFMPTFRSKW